MLDDRMAVAKHRQIAIVMLIETVIPSIAVISREQRVDCGI